MDVSPTVVAIFDVGFAEPRKVAEFRLAPNGSVGLTINDPDGCPVAEEWYARGVKLYDPMRRVSKAEGVQFLRALLELPAMSYYRVVDESPNAASDSPTGPSQHGMLPPRQHP